MSATLPPETERELLATCTHEAGHEVVADHFGLDGRAFVASSQDGVCLHERGSLFQEAAICWAGPLAEDMVGARHPRRTLPELPNSGLAKEGLWNWFEATLGGGLVQLSREDWYGIVSCSDKWGPCRTAFQVLSERRVQLGAVTRALQHEARARLASADDPREGCEELRAFVESRSDRESERRRLEASAALAERIGGLAPAVPQPPKFDFDTFLIHVVFPSEPASQQGATQRFARFAAEEAGRYRPGGASETEVQQHLSFLVRYVGVPEQWNHLAREYTAWCEKENDRTETEL